MNAEYTGRHFEVTPAIREEVESGLVKIRKILGNKFETKVVLAVEKRRHKAEITITPRNGPLVGLAQAGDMTAAINEALEQAVHVITSRSPLGQAWRECQVSALARSAGGST